ncbi:MAG: integrase core domain-containing protein [Nocardioides sp.]
MSCTRIQELRRRRTRDTPKSPETPARFKRFNGTMSRELFGHEIYHSVVEVRHVVNEWTIIYNTRRAHRGLAGKTPAAYAKMYPETQDP